MRTTYNIVEGIGGCGFYVAGKKYSRNYAGEKLR